MTRILIYTDDSDPLWAGKVSYVPREGERIALWDRSPVLTLVVSRVILRLPENEVYVHCILVGLGQAVVPVE